jgi:hypothetical protein
MADKPDLKVVAPDPFDPASLRLDQTFIDGPAVKKLLTTIPVRRPGPQEFVRTHPDEAYRVDTAVIILKDDREVYLITRDLIPELIDEAVRVTLVTTINRQGTLTIWPVRLPGPDGKTMSWWTSAREASELAIEKGCALNLTRTWAPMTSLRQAAATFRIPYGPS